MLLNTNIKYKMSVVTQLHIYLLGFAYLVCYVQQEHYSPISWRGYG
jgi:hypothetical protein